MLGSTIGTVLQNMWEVRNFENLVQIIVKKSETLRHNSKSIHQNDLIVDPRVNNIHIKALLKFHGDRVFSSGEKGT